MTRLFTFLRAAWLFATQAGWCPQPEWSDEDREALGRFLNTPTGGKLRLTLMSQIAAANERAARKATTFECGWACGYRGLWAWFEALSPAGAQSGNLEESGPGVPDDLAQYHP